MPLSSKHSLAPRQRTFNINPPGLSRYYYYALITNANCQKTFAKLDLQISAELPNPKRLSFAKITFLSKHSLVPRQRSFNIDPPGLSRYYYYTSTVKAKCQKTFAKLDLQISAELPNPKLLFFAKIPFLKVNIDFSAPRQRSFNIDPRVEFRKCFLTFCFYYGCVILILTQTRGVDIECPLERGQTMFT